MKRFLTAVAVLLLFLPAPAQEQAVHNNNLYVTRYKLLVANVGDCGLGVKTFLDKWEAADSLDINMMLGRFNYFLAQSGKDTLIMRDARTYLGNKPVFTLKDSTGKSLNYFEETIYDDAIFGKALQWIDKAIASDNTRMELFVAKANALTRYEKENPDMTVQYLNELIYKRFTNKSRWKYYDEDMTAEIFDSIIQDYCYSFFKTGSPASYEAFRTISEKMLKFEPNNVLCLDNLGSYNLVVKKNYGKAKKYYSKALKINPDDETAKKNMEVLTRLSAKKK